MSAEKVESATGIIWEACSLKWPILWTYLTIYCTLTNYWAFTVQTSCKLPDFPVLYNDILKKLGQKFRRMRFSVRQSVLRLLNRHLTSLMNCHSEVTNWQYYITRVIPLWLVLEVMVESRIKYVFTVITDPLVLYNNMTCVSVNMFFTDNYVSQTRFKKFILISTPTDEKALISAKAHHCCLLNSIGVD